VALVVVDFDGTITVEDSLVAIVQAHAPEVFDEVEDALMAGRISLRECIRREFEAVAGDHDDIVREAVARTRVRAGFAPFVDAARPGAVPAQGGRAVRALRGLHGRARRDGAVAIRPWCRWR